MQSSGLFSRSTAHYADESRIYDGVAEEKIVPAVKLESICAESDCTEQPSPMLNT